MLTEDERKEILLIIRQYLEEIGVNTIDEVSSAIDEFKQSDSGIQKALALAVKAIYFDDARDYRSFMYSIVEILGGEEAVSLCENNISLAVDKYCTKMRG